jgi:GNAT superfamily N-acetyltransferase
MGTDPLHQKRGAATMLVQWGIERCKREGFLAYLESTMEAVSLYMKNGFTVGTEISLRIDGSDESSSSKYEECACIFRPEKDSE